MKQVVNHNKDNGLLNMIRRTDTMIFTDEVVVAKFANTTRHGAMKDKTQTHDKEYFNLEMVISASYPSI